MKLRQQNDNGQNIRELQQIVGVRPCERLQMAKAHSVESAAGAASYKKILNG